MLSLADYRELLQIDKLFVPPSSRPSPKQVPAWVDRLLAGLLLIEDGIPKRASLPPRQVLYAALTIRPALPLPAELLFQLDALLAQEAAETPTVSVDSLPYTEPPVGREVAGDTARILWKGDITTLRVDAIVNAANSALLGCFQPFHSCIDNRIHAVAGPRLRADCQRIIDLQGHAEPTGAAKLTRGYHLPSRYVLHTVGPIVSARESLATRKQSAELAACYRACLDAAAEVPSIRSIALCCVSTGVFGFPREQAAQIALKTVREWLTEHPQRLDRIVFNVFTDQDESIYRTLWNRSL